MGYCMTQQDSDFFVSAANLPKMVKAIQSLHGNESIRDTSGRHFSWVESDFFVFNDAERILQAWRWNGELDGEGNINAIYFEGEKLGDDNVLFDAIAPFVKAGSFIEMRGEDGERWRWCFDGKTMVEKQAIIEWR